ncbi:beta-alanine-activating enzyme isoform X2 [Pseudoliparis swirei]|uniref:beta-alanine-activating enzyme isoform X2 n=1 Tax=Pseudoliparis swirei TaxID=2059687 RepID=UPI0024BDB615|nr:beta-alanine-activating enzyme isoform X2 [Pseudoliparis swirei]
MVARTLHELVAAAASLHPDRTAVKYDAGSGSPASLLRYRDLMDLAGELAGVLRQNCSPGTGVMGLYCSDDLFTPVWILGILQTPAAYVPLDPDAPGLLTSRVLDRVGLQFCAVKTDELQRFQDAVGDHASVEVLSSLPKFRLTLVRLAPRGPEHGGARAAGGAAAPTAGGSREAGPGDLAYVLHTSGTTGLPKIVRVPHRCILPNILHLRSLFQMSPDDVVLLASPLTFDPSVVDVFLALSSGAQLLVVPAAVKRSPGRLTRLLFTDNQTSVLQVTPTLLGRFGRRALRQEVLSPGSPLRLLALGGEACPSPAVLRSWRHEDNRTLIFNLYGVTEVSCWASAHHIPESVLRGGGDASSVPLGVPLMDTALEVRDEGGRVVTEGEGQVFIGGEDRVCLLDDEEEAVAGTMRATGDWVEVRGAQMFHLGRRDRLVKRHGKRVHLDGVQQLISSLPEVEVCVVALHGGQRLLAFVVASAAERGEVVRPSAPPPDGDLRRLILNQLSLLLPSHSIPDTLVLVPALSMTPHGKVDMEALMETHQRRGRVASTELKPTLSSLWQEALALPEDAAVDEASNFLSSGGDSLKALHLHEEILAAAGAATSPELLEVILDGTFSDVLRHVERAAAESEKRHADERHADEPPALLAKRQRTTAVEDATPAGEVTGDEVLGLELSWSSDTGRCVDASPVLLASAGGATAFIGSHSHRIQALDLTAGRLLWERVLGGRIEASAAVSRCGRLVVVGCYDGRVYFLCAASGETRWTFQTGDAVKSRAAVDPLTGLVMVGSHDGHVYALDPEGERCVWRRHCGGGAVFSSPRLHPSLRRLYAASLGGRFLCLDPDTGAVLWSHRRDVPFFSSPDAAAGRVAVGSVDGNICCYSDEGELVWQFLTEGPVFSSPRVTPDHQGVLCGSHDGRLRRVSLADGSPVWSFRAPGKVYSSPCVLDGSVVGRGGTLVVLASTDGTVGVLDGRDGRLLASLRLPGELFSSPAAHGRSVVIGCRNDFVYCLNLTVKKGT